MLRALLRYMTRLWRRAPTQSPPRHPPVGLVRFGSLRRPQPIGRIFGSEWGQCIDRYYIESFLARHAVDIHGHVLEVADDTYTQQFGGAHVQQSDVLHVSPQHPGATVIADLTCAEHVLSETFDCIIFTQTLQFIYDVRAALRTLYRILNPAGYCWPPATASARSPVGTWTIGENTGALRRSLLKNFLLKSFLKQASPYRRMATCSPPWPSCTGSCQRSCVRRNSTTLILTTRY